MFEQISEKLPRYSRQFDLISNRSRSRQEGFAVGHWKWEDKKWDSYYTALAKSLAYVYQDILSFCQDTCSILPRQGLGEPTSSFFSFGFKLTISSKAPEIEAVHSKSMDTY
jgi:hypothetical protein